MMGLLWCFLIWMVAMKPETVLGDFDVHGGSDGPSFNFIYHTKHNLLLTISGQSCYFAFVEGRIHDDLFADFKLKLEEQVKSAVTAPDTIRRESSTLEEMKLKFNDPPAQSNCSNRDIYLINIDYLHCDMESAHGLCAWTTSRTQTMQWKLHAGSTRTTLTGPDTDHTTGTSVGQYVYVEANDGQQGDVAELVSPVISGVENVCLHFWHSMYGQGVGRLSVEAKSVQHGFNDSKVLWSESKNQGQGWKLTEVTVPRSVAHNSYVTLHFLASRGSSIYADIALDDISSTPGVCVTGLLECSFEHHNTPLCEWSQVGALDSMDWKTKHGNTSTDDTGPSHADPSAGNEYLYMEGDDGYPGDFADLQSPVVRLTHPLCLQFLYFMAGSGVGELDVILLDRSTMTEHLLWGRSGDQPRTGQNWNTAQVTVTSPGPDAPVQLLFRATRGSSVTSDIAIDAIKGLSGSCDQYTGAILLFEAFHRVLLNAFLNSMDPEEREEMVTHAKALHGSYWI